MRRVASAERAGAAVAAAWLLAVVVIEAVRAASGEPRAHDLAATPAGVAAGKLWELLSSGLLVSGLPVVQLIGAAVVVGVAVRLLGGAGFWATALVAHVGSALLVYLAVAALWLFARSHARGLVHDADFGISCVWLGALGALAARGLARRHVRKRPAVLALGAVAIVLALLPTGRLASPEHAVAWLLGAITYAALLRRRWAPLAAPLRA